MKNVARAMASGYISIAANIAYTLISVPLALRYLGNEQFGLWAAVVQISGFLLLIDMGMAGSISRILIDYKDQPSEGSYGAVIKTGTLVLGIQGVIIIAGGSGLSFWLAELCDIPMNYRRDFVLLISAQCLVMGGLFAGRIFTQILYAHQRYDLNSYASTTFMAVGIGVMWFCFERGWGVYSLLAANAVASLVLTAFGWIAVVKLNLLPPAGAWGRANRRTFNELFRFGQEIFLLSIGQQLVSITQIPIITRTLGLEAVTTWSIATKSFTLAQQLVYRILDFSGGAFSEMIVRGERDRLLKRLRDVVILSASLSVWAGLTLALCNGSFLKLWTATRISWEIGNDWLMAVMVMLYSTTRCFIGFIATTKQIHAMKYVYLAEGALFVLASVLTIRQLGFRGVILSAIVTNVLFSGVYGFWRTRRYFQMPGSSPFSWLCHPLLFFVVSVFLFGVFAWLTRTWSALPQLSASVAFSAIAGSILFWKLGLSGNLKGEAKERLTRFRSRFIAC